MNESKFGMHFFKSSILTFVEMFLKSSRISFEHLIQSPHKIIVEPIASSE